MSLYRDLDFGVIAVYPSHPRSTCPVSLCVCVKMSCHFGGPHHLMDHIACKSFYPFKACAPFAATNQRFWKCGPSWDGWTVHHYLRAPYANRVVFLVFDILKMDGRGFAFEIPNFSVFSTNKYPMTWCYQSSKNKIPKYLQTEMHWYIGTWLSKVPLLTSFTYHVWYAVLYC